MVDSPAGDTVFPSAFDLADGLPRSTTVSDVKAPALVVCGERFSLADRAVASQRVENATRGDFTVRGMSVYPDAATARAMATSLIVTFETCPRFIDGRGREWTTRVRASDLGDEGWMVTRFGDAPAPRGDLTEAVQLVRVDTMLLLVHTREIHGMEPEILSRGTAQQVESLLHRQVCLLSDRGCAWRSDPNVLRPDGWGPVRLGMSREELEATGDVAFISAGGCTTADLGSGHGVLSEADELVSITAPPGVTTPDGIGSGSSREEVLDQYYYGERGGDVVVARASPTTDYEFTLAGDEVIQLTLSTAGDECLG